MNALQETKTLSNGVEIPVLQLGTWLIDDADAAVKSAVELGYRGIDTAQAYGNEAKVGEGMRASGVAREDLFVVSKIAAELKTYDEAAASIDKTLTTMGLDYLDMMIIHAPQPWDDFRGGNYDEGNVAAYCALEDAYKAGKLRAIGVSNFLVSDLQNILDTCSVAPMVNQILAHIGDVDEDVVSFCESQDIVIEAYSPIAHGEALKYVTIVDMAAKYGVTPAQLCIRYVLQCGFVALPKTANPEHMAANAAVDFEISAEDMAALQQLKQADYGEFDFFPVFSGK